MDASLSVDRDAEMLDSGGNRGGWIIYFFIIGTLMCLTLAAGGWQSNLIVYLIQEYNVKSIDAAQVSNAVNGCTCLFPIIGAIIADSFSGCFLVILISSCISFLGLVLLVLTATLDSLRPPSCDDGLSLCETPSESQFAVLYAGSNFYRRDTPQGSPFVNIVRVLVASIRKRKVLLSSRSEDYHYHNDGEAKMVPETHKKSLSFLNGAALKTEGDLKPDGSIAKPWSLCTFQQVEDLKTVIRIFPLWSSSLFISTPIAIQSSLTTLQALTMDRRIVSHFKIPVGSLPVLVLLSTCISLPIIDRFLYPVWQKLTNQSPTPLQRLGIGHVLNIISMVVSALVESRRLKTAHSSTLPMLVMWLFPQLALVGIGEAFHFPGQLQLCYQEFPASLRGTATAMVAMTIGIAYYTGTALIGLVRRVTGWLPDDINQGRLDNVYWMVVVIGVLNFGYYLSCAQLYKHQNVSEGVERSSGSAG
ncbi:hypothetical protein PRUPE_6G091800 [Prunus persica]|uniref:Uncharacterized protein n=2 Tax=Prunus persica TaxID=3760 RepID=A0A251NMD7_PRUPE|nr:hypothetical protein PRUPE_6G091800 [Prunus persica]